MTNKHTAEASNSQTSASAAELRAATPTPVIDASKLIHEPDHADDTTLQLGGIVIASTKPVNDTNRESDDSAGKGGSSSTSVVMASSQARGDTIRLELTHKVIDRRAGRTVMERIWASQPNMNVVRSKLSNMATARAVAAFCTSGQITGIIGGTASSPGLVTKTFTYGHEVICNTLQLSNALIAFRWPAGTTDAGQPLSADAITLLMELINPIMYSAGMVAHDDYSMQMRYSTAAVGIAEMVNDSIARHAHVAVTGMKVGIEDRCRVTGAHLGMMIARKLRDVGYAIIDTTSSAEIVSHVVAGVGAYLDRTDGNHYVSVPIAFRNHALIAELSHNSTFALAALDATADFAFTMTTADAIAKLELFVAALRTSERYDIVSYATLIKAYGLSVVDTNRGQRAFMTVHQNIKPAAVGMTVLSSQTGTANSRHIVPTSPGASQAMAGYYEGSVMSPADSAGILRHVVADLVDSDAVSVVDLPLVRIVQPPVCGGLMTPTEMAIALSDEIYVVPRRHPCILSAQYVHGQPCLITSRTLTGYRDSGMFYTDEPTEVIFVSAPRDASNLVVPGEQLIDSSALRTVVLAAAGSASLGTVLTSTHRRFSYTFDVLGASVATEFETQHLPGFSGVTAYSSTVVPWYNAAIFQSYTTELDYASQLIKRANTAVAANPDECASRGFNPATVANLRVGFLNLVAQQLLRSTSVAFPAIKDIVTRRAMRGSTYAASEAIEIAMARPISAAYVVVLTSSVMHNILKLNNTMLPGMTAWDTFVADNPDLVNALVTQIAYGDKKWAK